MYYDMTKGIGLTAPSDWPTERAALSIEGFSEINPEYIFISDNDHAFTEQLEQTSVLKSLEAVKQGHVYPIDLLGLTGGPLAVKYGVDTVIDALNQ